MFADYHPLFRSALSGALRAEMDGIVIVETHDLDSILQSLESVSDLDLLLLDLKSQIVSQPKPDLSMQSIEW